jgi:hypothetical protein
MSDVSSAGIARGTPGYGKACRKDVLGRVDIPVVPGPAGRARPVPGRQAQLREPVPARRTRLGAGIPAVYHDQLASSALAFVGELAAELAPPAVGDRAGQVPVADHAGHVQVLDHDRVRRADQAGAGAVQEVPAGVTYLAVGAGDPGRRLGPVRRAALAAGQPALVAGEPAALRSRCRGLAIRSPPEVTAKSFTPRSTPTARPRPRAAPGRGRRR